MDKIVFILSICIAYTSAFAGERNLITDNENYFATGFSENPSEALAKQDACNSARRELIGYIFGSAYQINQNMVRTLGVLDYSQDVSVSSGEIIIRGAISETSSSHGNTKCTISYPIQEAKIELERLKSTNNQKSVHFTEVGVGGDIKGGVLEVVTIPSDVDVLVDNVRWGTTPLRLNGRLSVGKHNLRLEHDDYKVIEEAFETGTLSKVRIEKLLKRATARLIVKSEPSGATIKINGQEVGISPTQPLELPAGQRLKIEILHPETEIYSQSLKLNRDDEKTILAQLPFKPAQVSINVNPGLGVVLKIDGRERPDLNRWIQLEPGKHEILVRKNGYEDQKLEIELRGGQKLAVPTIELKREDLAKLEKLRRLEFDRAAEKQAEERDRYNREVERAAREPKKLQSIFLGTMVGISGSTFKDIDPSLNLIGLLGKYQFSKYLGVESSILYSSGKVTYSDSTLNVVGFQLAVGLPIRLYQSNAFAKRLVDRVSVDPAVVYSNQTYTANYTASGNSSTGSAHSQVGYGIGVVNTLFTNTENGEMGYFWDGKLAYHKYQDTDGLQGASALSIGVAFGVTW